MTAPLALVQFDKFMEGLDVQPLYSYVKRNKHLFEIHKERQSYEGSAHVDTKTIFLRGPLKFTREEYQENIDAYDYDVPHELVSLVSKLIHPCLDFLDIRQLGYMMIVSLVPGGEITEHIDQGRYAEYYDRFHIPLYSKEGNYFRCGDEEVQMGEGELWTFNHHMPHSVVNNSDRERIHLIFDGE